MRKRNFLLAAIFHIVIIIPLVFFASREGMLGKKMKEITVTMVPKAKQEPEKPKVEQPKVELPKPIVPTEQPKVVPQTVQQTLPPLAPSVAPPPVEMPSINFSDGAKEVRTSSDPIELYKSYIESQFKSQWKTPLEKDYETMVDISITDRGDIQKMEIASNNGDSEWTRSVTDAMSKIKALKPPPKGFPSKFKIRFDTAQSL